jgi:hypothetical protein
VNDTLSGSSEAERVHLAAERRYEQALATMARRADSLDGDWKRFKAECYEGRIAGSFDHEWFSIFDAKAMQGAVAPRCGAWFKDVREEAYTIRNTVQQLEEAARKEDILPGIRRGLRSRYHLDYAGWDR